MKVKGAHVVSHPLGASQKGVDGRAGHKAVRIGVDLCVFGKQSVIDGKTLSHLAAVAVHMDVDFGQVACLCQLLGEAVGAYVAFHKGEAGDVAKDVDVGLFTRLLKIEVRFRHCFFLLSW